MNWRENAHLFSNGNFQVKHEQLGLRYITGYDFEDVIFWCGRLGIPVSECTLIARHIDGMTDEEAKNLSWFKAIRNHPMVKRQEDSAVSEGVISKTVEDIGKNKLKQSDFLFLLSIGVYPFPWPKDGSVIRREL